MQKFFLDYQQLLNRLLKKSDILLIGENAKRKAKIAKRADFDSSPQATLYRS